jgi:hypothetical protein
MGTQEQSSAWCRDPSPAPNAATYELGWPFASAPLALPELKRKDGVTDIKAFEADCLTLVRGSRGGQPPLRGGANEDTGAGDRLQKTHDKMFSIIASCNDPLKLQRADPAVNRRYAVAVMPNTYLENPELESKGAQYKPAYLRHICDTLALLAEYQSIIIHHACMHAAPSQGGHGTTGCARARAAMPTNYSFLSFFFGV